VIWGSRLAPDQDKDSCKERQYAGYNSDAKSGESKDSDRDKINREQKHTYVFRNHVVSIVNWGLFDILKRLGQSIANCRNSPAADAHYDCRDILQIDERVEIFRSSEVRKVDDIVGNLRDFTSQFFSRSQMHFDRFAGASLKYAEDTGIGLQASFLLRE
jgi:hypothetical protein